MKYFLFQSPGTPDIPTASIISHCGCTLKQMKLVPKLQRSTACCVLGLFTHKMWEFFANHPAIHRHCRSHSLLSSFAIAKYLELHVRRLLPKLSQLCDPRALGVCLTGLQCGRSEGRKSPVQSRVPVQYNSWLRMHLLMGRVLLMRKFPSSNTALLGMICPAFCKQIQIAKTLGCVCVRSGQVAMVTPVCIYTLSVEVQKVSGVL